MRRSTLLVETAQEAICAPRTNDWFYFNPGERLYGYSDSELSSMHFLEMVYEDDRELLLQNYRKRLAGAALSRATKSSLRKDGTVAWVELKATLIEWNAARPLVFLNDITTPESALRELMETKSQAGAWPIERHKGVRLKAMRRIGRKAIFLPNEHEIRTPMNGVLGMAGLLLDTELNEEPAAVCRGCARSANRSRRAQRYP